MTKAAQRAATYEDLLAVPDNLVAEILFGALVTLEMGKIRAEGEGEVQEMIDICDFAVGLSRQLYGLTMHSERPGHRMYEQWHPLGVVGVISAFNFPVAVWSWNSALSAVCGNSTLWKPSSKTPLTAPAAAGSPPAIDLDAAAIESALGVKGKNNGGVYQFSIPRAEQITAHGMTVPASLGTSTAINFQPTGGGKAAITGDFVMVGKEVNAVLRTLRANGIEVTALHSHMIDDSPHLYFMHFWANDDAGKLAKGLRKALDAMNVKPGP